MAELLMSKGADSNITIIVFIIKIIKNKRRKLYKKDQIPLHFALEKNFRETGALLISKGADINAKDIIYLNIII